jgi:hypothetical protein
LPSHSLLELVIEGGPIKFMPFISCSSWYFVGLYWTNIVIESPHWWRTHAASWYVALRMLIPQTSRSWSPTCNPTWAAKLDWCTDETKTPPELRQKIWMPSGSEDFSIYTLMKKRSNQKCC